MDPSASTRYSAGQYRFLNARQTAKSLSTAMGNSIRMSFIARRTFARSCSNSNSGECTPITTNPSAEYLFAHARTDGSVRSQLIHVYVQKSMSTTFPRRLAAVSGGVLIHVVALRSD